MSTSDTLTKQQWQDQEALHRFQLISPLLQTGLDDARRLQLRRTIADENHLSVRTLYRYEKAFAEKQFAGLRPADREKRRSQVLPENFETKKSIRILNRFLMHSFTRTNPMH